MKEYLTDEQRSRYSRLKLTAKAKKATDPFFGEGNNVVREKLLPYEPEKSQVHKDVESALGHEISIPDYQEGKITDKHGRRVKLGTQIKDDSLRNRYASDSIKTGSTKGIEDHSISVHRGVEVAGQTNPLPSSCNPSGHSWKGQSCKNVETGSNVDYLKPEIQHGTVVVFAHDKDGKEVYRATLQPHHSDAGDTAYAIDSEYGMRHPAFTAHAQNVAERLSGEYRPGIYSKNDSVYNNNDNDFMLHPKATEDEINKALNDPIRYYRRAAVAHPNLKPYQIDTALKDKDAFVAMGAIRHRNATKGQLDRAMKKGSVYVRQAALKNPNADRDHHTLGLNDPSPFVRAEAINHSFTNTNHLLNALDDKNANVKLAAVRHPKADRSVFEKASTDKSAIVSGYAKKKIQELDNANV